MAWNIRNVLFLALNIIMGVLGFFIGFRFILNLVAANPNTPFVAWINSTSESLIYPFSGIVGNPRLGNGQFDLVALIALLAYGILFYVIEAIIDVALRPRKVVYQDTERVI